ncbi:MAG TPA: hypothetical protein DDY32_18205 [Desulfobulbaceae bacterium]|nr:hypothetical protein [Desulfobulbaceae bacterium]
MANFIKCSIIIFLTLLGFCGCAHLVKIEDPNVSFEGTSYIIKPPSNGEWFYNRTKNLRGNITYLFGRRNQSETLSNYAVVTEKISPIYFFNEECFLDYVKSSVIQSNDPQRMELVESEFEIKKFLGAKDISFYVVYKDLSAPSKGNTSYLYVKTAGNVIIHPDKRNLLIQLDYSERGVESELDEHFKENAARFFNNFTFKKI